MRRQPGRRLAWPYQLQIGQAPRTLKKGLIISFKLGWSDKEFVCNFRKQAILPIRYIFINPIPKYRRIWKIVNPFILCQRKIVKNSQNLAQLHPNMHYTDRTTCMCCTVHTYRWRRQLQYWSIILFLEYYIYNKKSQHWRQTSSRKIKNLRFSPTLSGICTINVFH